jgi:hypothetical protein
MFAKIQGGLIGRQDRRCFAVERNHARLRIIQWSASSEHFEKWVKLDPEGKMDSPPLWTGLLKQHHIQTWLRSLRIRRLHSFPMSSQKYLVCHLKPVPTVVAIISLYLKSTVFKRFHWLTRYFSATWALYQRNLPPVLKQWMIREKPYEDMLAHQEATNWWRLFCLQLWTTSRLFSWLLWYRSPFI